MTALVGVPGTGFEPIRWEEGVIRVLDQRRLPLTVTELQCVELEQLAEAIRTLAVRGAPLIGIAAAYGLAQVAGRIAAHRLADTTTPDRQAELEAAAQLLRSTRPTAVNLFWAIERMVQRAAGLTELTDVAWAAALLGVAQEIHQEDRWACRAIGEAGATLVPPAARILTHCNAGALATGGWGTALGVVRAAHARDPRVRVYADETRPLLQGARLTAWELEQDGIPVTLLADDMAGWAMARGMIDLVVVGADRIAANGDAANKIGTYTVAVLAHHHRIPFYVAAPTSTWDLSLDHGGQIPIEERHPDEVRTCVGHPSAPARVAVFNPAFDVTPAELITAILCEHGVIRPPYREGLRVVGRRSAAPIGPHGTPETQP